MIYTTGTPIKKIKPFPLFIIFLYGHMFGVLMAKTCLPIRTKNNQILSS